MLLLHVWCQTRMCSRRFVVWFFFVRCAGGGSDKNRYFYNFEWNLLFFLFFLLLVASVCSRLDFFFCLPIIFHIFHQLLITFWHFPRKLFQNVRNARPASIQFEGEKHFFVFFLSEFKLLTFIDLNALSLPIVSICDRHSVWRLNQ